MAIKIFEELWYVQRGTEALSYMTQVDESKTAFYNKVETGCKWAYVTVDVENGVKIKNDPQNGFYIGSSVSRWSTSNKLFRVRDPRGFEVEVPTDNIATLLHLTTVKNGVIQEQCVWGRDGANHILLPVNSEPYIEGMKNTKKIGELIKPSSLVIGDVCTLLVNGYSGKYTYLGRTKKIGVVVNKHAIDLSDIKNSWDSPKWGEIIESSEIVVKDDNGYAFVYHHETVGDRITFISKPNVVEILENKYYDKKLSTNMEYDLPISIRQAAKEKYDNIVYQNPYYRYGEYKRECSPRSYTFTSAPK